MPFEELCTVDIRVQFVKDCLSGEYTKSSLCGHYGISRPTGDKWLARFYAKGFDGLEDLCRAPHNCPHATPDWIRNRIIERKKAKLHMGPKKIVDWLRSQEPEVPWPADSTVGRILKEEGLVTPRRLRRRVPPDTTPFEECTRSNRIWSADFKGQFKMGNGRWCYPLTITDNYSRYFFECRGLHKTTGAQVYPWFESIFRQYGLPEAIRTDNGAPFASRAVGGISFLSKWWIQLGVKPERIEPGKPSQNGRHERMHRSLKQAVLQPPENNLRRQQQAFNRFIEEYNHERSHEALGRKTPSEVYVPSTRSYPVKLEPIEYDVGMTVRSVRQNGEIKWCGHHIYVSEVLAKERVGLKQIDEGKWAIYYSFHQLGTLNEENLTIEACKNWHGKTIVKRKP